LCVRGGAWTRLAPAATQPAARCAPPNFLTTALCATSLANAHQNRARPKREQVMR
jgi:hypothetical protein